MNKKQLLLLSAMSALIISGAGAIKVFAADSGSSTDISKRIEELQSRYGITLTDEQKTQVTTKETEMQTKRAEELAKWEAMDLATWKQAQIDKINATTEEEFTKMKERQVEMLKNGGMDHRGGPQMGMEKPAE